MTDINQHFSVQAGDDAAITFDLGPDDNGVNLEFAEVTWTAYPQIMGVPDLSTPLIIKTAEDDIVIDDPLLMVLTILLSKDDLAGLAGNYYHDMKVVDDDDTVSTVATGLMTVIDPGVVPNVVAFKALFPDFAAVDDTLVQIALDAAGQFVDASWESVQGPATMYLAAHFLATADSTAGTSASGAEGEQRITSESIGAITVAYAKPLVSKSSKADAASTLGETPYGIVFSQMLASQGFGIAIV